MGITQSKLAEMLGLSNARVSEILNGKCEPSLKIGRELSRQLNIDPEIMFGAHSLYWPICKVGDWMCVYSPYARK